MQRGVPMMDLGLREFSGGAELVVEQDDGSLVWVHEAHSSGRQRPSSPPSTPPTPDWSPLPVPLTMLTGNSSDGCTITKP